MLAMTLAALLSSADGGVQTRWVHLSAQVFTLDDRPLDRRGDTLNIAPLEEALRDAPGPVTIAVDRDASWRELSRAVYTALSVDAPTGLSLIFDPRRPLEAAADVKKAAAVLTVSPESVTLDDGKGKTWPRGKPPAGVGRSLERATLVLRGAPEVSVGDVIAEWVALGCGACRATIGLSSPRPLLTAQSVFAKAPKPPTPMDVRRSDLQAAINGRLATITRCYETELEAHPDAKGKALAKFTVNGPGELTNLKVEGPFSDVMHACISRELATIKLGLGPQAEITYPFAFAGQ